MNELDKFMAEQDEATDQSAELTHLGNMLKRLQDLQDAADQQAASLKELNDEIDSIECGDIPELFNEMGISSMKLANGKSILINNIFNGKITKKDEFLDWLERTGREDLVKTEVLTKFTKGKKDEAIDLAANLSEEGYAIDYKRSIHSATLKKFLNECHKNDVELPGDLVEVTVFQRSKIK